MKILPQLTDPPLKNGLFMSAIFTLNTRRGHVVRVSFQRSCPSRHATIGRTPVNGSHRDKESRNTAVPVRSSAERLPLRAMRSEGYRFLLFACCSAFSAPPSPLRDRFSGLFVAPLESCAAYGAHGAVQRITPRTRRRRARRERRGAPPNPAGFSRAYARNPFPRKMPCRTTGPRPLRDVPRGVIAQKSAQNSALSRFYDNS